MQSPVVLVVMLLTPLAAPAGTEAWSALIVDEFETGAGAWIPRLPTKPGQVAVADGVLTVTDTDPKAWAGAIRRFGVPVSGSYKLEWRGAVSAGSYGGLYVHAAWGEVFHIGLGQGRSRDHFRLEIDGHDRDKMQVLQVPVTSHEQLHTYTIAVEGTNVTVSVDGKPAVETEFSGAAIWSVCAWSGIGGVGTTRTDRLTLYVAGEQAQVVDHVDESFEDVHAASRAWCFRERRRDGDLAPTIEPGKLIGARGVWWLDFRPQPRWTMVFRRLIGLVPGAQYTLRMRVFVRSGVSVARARVRGLGIDEDLGKCVTRDTRGKWRDLECTFWAPPGIDRGSLVFESAGGGGTFWLDSIQLRRNDPAISTFTTGLCVRRPPLREVRRRVGRMIEFEQAFVDKSALTDEDQDGDGRWSLARVEPLDNVFHFSEGTVVKSDSKPSGPGGCPATHFRFGELLPGKYHAFLADPLRGVMYSFDGRAWALAQGGRGEVSLGVHRVGRAFDFWVDYRDTQQHNPGPAYLDYVRFMPVWDDAQRRPARHAPQPRPGRSIDMALTVRETAGTARDGEWVVAGVPIPPGVLWSADRVGLWDGDAPVACCLRALTHWPDGSVQWLRVAFGCTVDANGERKLRLRDQESAQRETRSTETTVAATHGQWQGSVEGEWGADGWRRVGRRLAGPPLLTYRVAGEDREHRCRLAVREAPAEEVAWGREPVLRGAVREGDRPAPFTWACHISPQPSRQALKMSFTLVHIGRGAADLRDLRLDMGRVVDGTRAARWTQNLVHTPIARDTEALRLTQTVTGSSVAEAAFRWRIESVQGGRATVLKQGGRGDGIVHLVGDRGGCTIAVRDFAERAPKSIALVRRTDGLHLELGLLPDTGVPFRIAEGEAITVHAQLAERQDATPDAEILGTANGLLRPLRTTCEPRDYCASRVFGFTRPREPVRFAKYEAALARAFTQICTKQSAYGWEDWGGVFQFGGYVPGTERLWTNMEYDFCASCLSQFVRTGDHAYMERAVAATQHFHDADLIHAHRRADWVGGSHTHSHSMRVGHQIEDPNFGHAGWVQGPLWVYYLTGERAGLRVADKIAGYVCRNAAPWPDYTGRLPRYALLEERDCGHPLLTLMAAYEATGDPKYLDAAQPIVDYAMRCQEPVDGNWRTPINEDPPYRGTTFMVSPLIRGLAMYREWIDDPRVDQSLALFGKWLVAHGRAPNGGYYHKASPKYAPGANLMAMGWYAHMFPMCARAGADAAALRRQALDDFTRFFVNDGLNLLWGPDHYDRERRKSEKVAGGKLGVFHDYELVVHGDQATLQIDGKRAAACQFSGLPMTGATLWSGMKAVGAMAADWFEYATWDEAHGKWRVVLRDDFDHVPGEAWELRDNTRDKVSVRDGMLRVQDPDREFYGLTYSTPTPATRYRIRWRQRLESGMYGGLIVRSERGDTLHVGVGQAARRGKISTNPRSFAPHVQNFNELIGWLGRR